LKHFKLDLTALSPLRAGHSPADFFRTILGDLKPRYVMMGAAKLLNLTLSGLFTSVFIQDEVLLAHNLKHAFKRDGAKFDKALFRSLLHTPAAVPTPSPIDCNQLLVIVVIILIWEKLTLADYVDYVGTLHIVKMGVRHVDVVATYCPYTYHRGSHAYIGAIRPYSVQLSQAVRALVEILNAVSSAFEDKVHHACPNGAYRVCKSLMHRRTFLSLGSKVSALRL
jgi:hypothetical protein